MEEEINNGNNEGLVNEMLKELSELTPEKIKEIVNGFLSIEEFKNKPKNYSTKIHGKTVHFIGSKCFTEDKIPIYSICLSGFPVKKSILDLEKDMSLYGEVVNIKRFKNIANPKAIVTFRKAQSASKILMTNENTGSQMRVEPAFSWMQPKFEAAKIQQDDNRKDEKYFFDYLPNECLYYMFNFLTFNDHVKLSRMSKKLMETFKLFYKTKKTMKINKTTINDLTLLQVRQALIDIGYKIETMKLSKTENDNILFEFILKFCPNLKLLELCGINFRTKDIRRDASQRLKKLKTLHLKHCIENGIDSVVAPSIALEHHRFHVIIS